MELIQKKEGVAVRNDKQEQAIRSSAAEYLTFVAATGDSTESMEMRYEDENIWLTQKMMTTLYDVGLPTINEHIKKILACILARGHVLLEDIPGVGKTNLTLALSKALSLDFHRMQFTSDVLPGDVTGFIIYNQKTNDFEYKEGPIMCNLFLADEINRTSPKTQSALLEVMEEGRTTVDGITYQLPQPFTVLATQNPYGSAGTQLLPDSQLDRFMVRLTMGYPSLEDEIEILKRKSQEIL